VVSDGLSFHHIPQTKMPVRHSARPAPIGHFEAETEENPAAPQRPDPKFTSYRDDCVGDVRCHRKHLQRVDSSVAFEIEGPALTPNAWTFKFAAIIHQLLR